jgi:hypothetical protein
VLKDRSAIQTVASYQLRARGDALGIGTLTGFNSIPFFVAGTCFVRSLKIALVSGKPLMWPKEAST